MRPTLHMYSYTRTGSPHITSCPQHSSLRMLKLSLHPLPTQFSICSSIHCSLYLSKVMTSFKCTSNHACTHTHIIHTHTHHTHTTHTYTHTHTHKPHTTTENSSSAHTFTGKGVHREWSFLTHFLTTMLHMYNSVLNYKASAHK